VGKRVVVWVEGDRDRRFFEAVVKPFLAPPFDQVLVKEYRQTKPTLINRLLRAMSHQGFDHIFVTDMNSAPCATIRKQKVKERYPDLKDGEIIVVSKEIESWYLAGLNADGEAALKVKCPASTDNLTKEDLDRLMPSRFDSNLDFLVELLKYFDVTTARRRNKSFEYFHRRHL
jgi:hypothetical protein